MKYIDIYWHNDSQDEPYRLVSEIGADGYEKRKLEFFRNGNIGYATGIETSNTTMLAINKIPALEAIISQPDFSGEEISRDQFERLWDEHVSDDS